MIPREYDYSKLFPEEDLRKTFQKIFDQNVIRVIHGMASQGHIDHLEYTIATGKEAHVFRAVDIAGHFRAVKIYKLETSDFKRMEDYLRFEPRFQKVRNDRRQIVFAWTQKEFSSLQKLRNKNVPVPMPLAAKENVLVMEFIGEKGKASPQLKDAQVKNKKAFYEKTCDAIAKMLDAQLIHGDLSEYNILVKKDKPVIIDCGQVIPTIHPNAKMYYERDLKNMLKVFHREGMKELTYEKLYEDVKKKVKRKNGGE
ncbi:MAG: serine protein kinase RIO [Candidatus Diapherotrites archaeon]